MQNFIKNRTAFEILKKKPLLKYPNCFGERDNESENESENEIEETAATTTVATSGTDETNNNTVGQLNANASEFIPKNDSLGELKQHFELLEERKPTQPKLLLPWKGFPKPMRAERSVFICEQKVLQSSDEIKSGSRLKRKQPEEQEKKTAVDLPKKQSKEKISLKDAISDQKKREQERKVALEALKLVEQRRMRETSVEEQPKVIVHLTRSPVDFTPEERKRVDRLRAIKKEHIERVLREMRQELEPKPIKTEPKKSTGRYVALQRAVKQIPEIELETKTEVEMKMDAKTEMEARIEVVAKTELETKTEVIAETKIETKLISESEMQPPRRYIPTVKQWDERCKAKANGTVANKENTMARKYLTRPEESDTIQRAMISSSFGNIMSSTNNISKEQHQSKDRELFVPRYRPPAPLVASGEKRRGNLTHARNISRAFPNCGLLPTPTMPGTVNPNQFNEQFFELPNSTNLKSVKRYEMKELLDLEPQPKELQKPNFRQDLLLLGFL